MAGIGKGITKHFLQMKLIVDQQILYNLIIEVRYLHAVNFRPQALHQSSFLMRLPFFH